MPNKEQQKKNRKIYNELKRKGMTDAEIAESFVFPSELTEEEEKEAREAFRKFLQEHRNKNKAQ